MSAVARRLQEKLDAPLASFQNNKVRNNTAYAAPLGGEYLRSCARHTSRILALLPDERSMSAPITVALNREAMLRR